MLFGHARGELGGGAGKGVGSGGNGGDGLVVKKGNGKYERDIFGITPGCEFRP